MKKIALVTGTNKGLGKGVSRLLLEKGCLVIMTSRNSEKGVMAYQELSKRHTDIDYHPLDVSDRESIRKALAYVETKYERLDILINNAAINYDQWHNALNADLDECRKTIEVNLFGQWMMIQEAYPLLAKSTGGRIVNVSSGAGALGVEEPGTPAYSISKAALNMLTIKVSHLAKKDGILVNSVCPGWVKTDMGGSEAPRSIEEGAESIAWAALLKDGGPTGGFYRDGQRIDW